MRRERTKIVAIAIRQIGLWREVGNKDCHKDACERVHYATIVRSAGLGPSSGASRSTCNWTRHDATLGEWVACRPQGSTPLYQLQPSGSALGAVSSVGAAVCGLI